MTVTGRLCQDMNYSNWLSEKGSSLSPCFTQDTQPVDLTFSLNSQLNPLLGGGGGFHFLIPQCLQYGDMRKEKKRKKKSNKPGKRASLG